MGHRTIGYVSFDTPHQGGAWLPIGLQTFAYSGRV